MNNVLTAIQAIVNNPPIMSANSSSSSIQNRANQMGVELEDYVKNAFANCIGTNQNAINIARSQSFSYLGGSNNPPDAILKGGDAIEIKKIANISTSQLQLNSSYPKNKFHSNNPKISKSCRDCEDGWQVKDMLYVVGQVNQKHLKNIFFVYGDLYCDTPDIYEKIENDIKYGLCSLHPNTFVQTKELGRINEVDHLGISDLRIRGMWLIKSPFIHFGYLTENIKEYSFKLVALIPVDKFVSFDNMSEFTQFCACNSVTVSDIDLPNPSNPAQLIKTKLIVYHH